MKCMKLIILLGIIICLTGCGSKYPPDWPKTYPCQITVTKDGQPYEGVTIVLARTENHGSWAVSGITDSSGVAVIETSWTKASSKGAPEGTFQVTLSKSDPPAESSISREEYESIPYDQRAAFMAAEAEKSRKNPLIPRALADPAKSEVEITVKSGETSTLAIEINEYL
ncbi:MAG: hypothetical protein ACRC2T_16955 [Thermoguttaceae bacterium]